MGSVIERPTFYEGQILSAADLQGAVDHAAGQLARHERYLHLWGVASGLALEKQGRSTAATPPVPYVDVTIKAGVAIDGNGREIVVPDESPLSEAAFDQSSVAAGASSDAWFPVFLLGSDQAGLVPSFGAGACASGQSSRTMENFLVQFGRPGDAADLDNQTMTTAVSDGAGDGGWRVLIGYVQWDSTIRKFKSIGTNDQGIKPRYTGVRADEVAARGGALVLRSQPRSVAGVPAVVMDATNGGELRFGLQDSGGNVKEVFTVNAKGDVIAKGRIQGAVTPGSVQIQSGTATDGILLPLPPGVTEDMVAPGKGTLHVQLTPRFGNPPTPGPDKWGGFPLECRVDDDRRLHCMTRWYGLNAPNQAQVRELPGLCDYLLIVAVAAAA